MIRVLLVAAVLAIATTTASAQQPSTPNYQGLWWGGASEAGWNLMVAHQDDVIFATWATYDSDGQSLWLSMTATQVAPTSFAGAIYRTYAPEYDFYSQFQDPYDDEPPAIWSVGQGVLTFDDGGAGFFTYTIGTTQTTKSIQKFAEAGRPPACEYDAAGLSTATNYTDLWIADPPSSDPQTAVGIAHVGDQLIVTWLTYDLRGSPKWWFGTAGKSEDGYAGDLVRTSGPAGPQLKYLAVGPLTVQVRDGNHINVSVNVNGNPFGEAFTRYVFRGKGTTCRSETINAGGR